MLVVSRLGSEAFRVTSALGTLCGRGRLGVNLLQRRNIVIPPERFVNSSSFSLLRKNPFRSGITWSCDYKGGLSSLRFTGVKIACGGEKVVSKGELTTPEGVEAVAVSINRMASGFLTRLFFGKEKVEQNLTKLREKVELEERLLRGFSDCSHIEQPSLILPLHLTDGVLRLSPLAKGSLDQLLTKEMTLPVALTILQDAAKGLSYLHAKELVHSNVKPETILVFQDMRGQLSDVGCLGQVGSAVVGDSTGYTDPARPSIHIGEPSLTKESDVYSFGLTLLDITTPSQWSVTEEQKKWQLEAQSLGRRAVQMDPRSRPAMKEIAQRLAFIAGNAALLSYPQLGRVNLKNQIERGRVERVIYKNPHQFPGFVI